MREIKFRAWRDGRMIGWPELSTPVFDGRHLQWLNVALTDPIGWHLMQFTGLKDKNGVEIYEGDVLRSDLGGECIEYVVQYRAPRFIFMTKYGAWAEDLPSDKNATEVIGNIHQSLKGEQGAR